MPTGTTTIVGNWKMHGDIVLAQDLANAAKASVKAGVEVVLCPPAVLLAQLAWFLRDSPIKTGGQDCRAEPQGAYTGDISAPMLKAAGASYVIVGHSERRQGHGETDAAVRAKAAAAIAAGLTPIICIGETLAERDSGKAREVVGRQVRESLPETAKNGHFLLAYEPVWAIGSGRTPSAADIGEMHSYITGVAGACPVLYGGSVKAANAPEILNTPGVSGVLVGGASLNAEEFSRIIAAAS